MIKRLDMRLLKWIFKKIFKKSIKKFKKKSGNCRNGEREGGRVKCESSFEFSTSEKKRKYINFKYLKFQFTKFHDINVYF